MPALQERQHVELSESEGAASPRGTPRETSRLSFSQITAVVFIVCVHACTVYVFHSLRLRL